MIERIIGTSARMILGALLLVLNVWPVSAQEKADPLLVLISVDGLRPDYITAADAHGAKVPNLRRFMKEGTYADGVTGVVPTVTYPSHTTLVTGVWPATHGIFANTTFDPLQKNYQGWYWYAEDIRVPTLWDVASKAGRTTASIQWPVTVGAKITWNIPEIWRAGTPEDAKLIRVLSTPGALDAVIGKVREEAEHIAPGRAYVAVVSDHGFAKYDQQLNLFPAFIEAKLMTLDDKGRIIDWKATPWETGGSAAIVPKDPQDQATTGIVRDLLKTLAADPANGIDRVLDADELHKRGGYPTASFFVSLKPGWRTGAALTGPVVAKIKPGGTHGELPDLPDVRAAFFLVGPGVPAGKDLGLIDMRDIAVTLAKEAGLSLASAEGKLLLP